MNNYNNKKANVWKTNNMGKETNKIPNTSNKAEIKFKEAQSKLQAAVQKYAKDYESSSDEDELETENVIDSILTNYKEKNLLGRTENFLQDAFISGAATCLICISTVKRNDSIWTCSECYCFFHLLCIQRWSKDTITQQKLALEDKIRVRDIKMKWSCPKCRFDYEPKDVPAEYLCFCKKTVDPTFQPLLIPHSCGNMCGKQLKPFCGHECVLLCHPGPCPPCPKMVKITCYCASKPPKMQRCSNKEWSCGSTCSKLLLCGKHKCVQSCHSGECLPCPKKSIQKCCCGTSQKLRDCFSPNWKCDKICNKPLECGNHNCMEVCHIDKCEPCILSKTRTCPCGKSYYQLPCDEDTPTCGDTCGKVLECGLHFCNQRCHKDKCGICVETIEKACRCGLHKKQVQCKKTYLCETKCKNMKDCNKHPCNRKCCDRNCPPCEKPCGRTLSCGNHKCSSVCHRGPCYPCNLTEKVYCHCNNTSITVACGRKQKTKAPKCNQACNNPPDCHHKMRVKHNCHFGNCPPCKQICNKNRPECSHLCPAPCHTVVLVKVEGQKASMPWENFGPQIEKKSLPCPDCVILVSVTCLGTHETSDLPCFIAKPYSCHRNCGRVLKCANHTCSKACHTVEGAKDSVNAGINCESCSNRCSKERPAGCQHECFNFCHPGPCAPCKLSVKAKCHCGLTQLHILCKEWTSGNEKEELQSCGNQCPKNLPCGHRCRSNCHSGPCPNANLCKKKVKVSCPCKRIKKEFQCELVRNGNPTVPCDEICEQKKQEESKLKELKEVERKKEEELKNKKEVEKYQKMFQAKKKHKDKRVCEDVKEDYLLQNKWFIFSLFVIVIFAVLYLFLV